MAVVENTQFGSDVRMQREPAKQIQLNRNEVWGAT